MQVSVSSSVVDGLSGGLSMFALGVLPAFLFRYSSVFDDITSTSIGGYFGLFVIVVGGSLLVEHASLSIACAASEADSLFNMLLPSKLFIGLLSFFLLIQFWYNIQQSVENEVVDSVEPVSNIEPEAHIDHLTVKNGAKIVVVEFDDILYFEADGDYVEIYTSNGMLIKELTMKSLMQQLPIGQFVRVHRSYIVNVKAIARIELYKKQQQLLILKNGAEIKTSPNGYRELKVRLGL